MRKYAWMIGILVVVLLAATLVGCCGKKQQAQSKATTGVSAKALRDLVTKQEDLTSYMMTQDSTGGVKGRTAMKLEGGRPIAMKIYMGQRGWVIRQMDKKMQYSYSSATRTVRSTHMPAGVRPMSSPADELKELRGAKISSGTIDGVDCLRVTDANGANTYWLDKEHGLPVQVQTRGETIRVKYEQINSVPDSEFKVPAGIKIEQAPS